MDIGKMFAKNRIYGYQSSLCNKDHLLQLLDHLELDQFISCNKCKSLIISDRITFGCTECGYYICNVCMDFNCILKCGLLRMKLENDNNCNLCKSSLQITDWIYGCDNCTLYKFDNNYMLRYNYGNMDNYIDYMDNIDLAGDEQIFKLEACGNTRCKSCQYINETNMVQSKIFGTKFKLSRKLS